MAKVEVAAVVDNDAAVATIQEDFDKAQDAIRELAYHVAARGRDVEFENWLQAEREVLWVPQCELVEQNGDFRLRAAVPGLEAKQVRLTALPEAIVIQGSGQVKVGKGENLLFSEFNRKSLLRRIELPMKIDTAGVKAKLERGVLEVVAPKTTNGAKSAKKAAARPKAERASAKKAALRKTAARSKKTV